MTILWLLFVKHCMFGRDNFVKYCLFPRVDEVLYLTLDSSWHPYSASQKKVYTFQKSPHINISKYFQEICIRVGIYRSLLSNDTKTSDDVVCLSEQEPHLWNLPKSRLDRNWYLFYLQSATLRDAKRLQNYHSDGLMTIYERICFVVCIFWLMPSTLMLH